MARNYVATSLRTTAQSVLVGLFATMAQAQISPDEIAPAKFDTAPKDLILSLEEQQRFEEKLALTRDSAVSVYQSLELRRVRALDGGKKPIALSRLRPYVGKDCSQERRFYIRRSVLTTSQIGCRGLSGIADGAKLSFSRDSLNNTSIIVINGAIAVPLGASPYRFEGKPGQSRSALALTQMGLALFVEGDGTRTTGQPDTGTIRSGLKADFAFNAKGLDELTVTSALYYQTDLGFGGSGYGLLVNVSPQIVSARINGVAPNAGKPTWYLRPSLSLDGFRIISPGQTGLAAGQDYLWLGGKLGFTYLDPRIGVGGMSLKLDINSYTDLMGRDSATLFDASLNYFFDRSKKTSIGLSYKKGEDYKSSSSIERTDLTYTVKF